MRRLMSIWRLLNLPCREMTRLASESFDRDLGRIERIALKSHLLYCMACRRYCRQVMVLRAALRQVVTQVETDQIAPGPGLPDDVRARIKSALKET